MFFKASSPTLGREPAITALLARRRPDVVPPPLAIDAERGWMLMADAGARLRELVEHDGDLTRWLDVLPRYAGMQLDIADDVLQAAKERDAFEAQQVRSETGLGASGSSGH